MLRKISSTFLLLLPAVWMMRDDIMPWWGLLVFGFMFVSSFFLPGMYETYRRNQVKNKMRQERYR